jgi:hypothetical protein
MPSAYCIFSFHYSLLGNFGGNGSKRRMKLGAPKALKKTTHEIGGAEGAGKKRRMKLGAPKALEKNDA